MEMITNDDIGLVISFNTHADGILGVSYKDVVVLGVTSADMVPGASPAERHRRVYPVIPESVNMPDDYRGYNYLTVRLPSGAISSVGLPWIIEDTILKRKETDVKVLIPNAGDADAANIRRILSYNGYKNAEVTVVSK